jgi:hypothetical protein
VASQVEIEKVEGEAPDFAIEAYQNWVRITAKGFQDKLGLEDAIEVMRPYSMNAAIALANNLSTAFGTNKSGIEDLATQWELADYCLGMNGETEITQYGTRTTVISCPFHDGPAILCIQHFSQNPQAWAEYMVPDLIHHEFIDALSKGDPRCFGYHSRISDLGKIMGAVALKTIRVTEVPSFDVKYFRALFLTDYWEFFIAMFIDQVGSTEMMELIGSKFYEQGEKDWQKLLGKNKLNSDKEALNWLMTSFSELFNQKGSSVVQRKDGLQREIAQCPFSNCRIEMCLLIEQYLKGLCHAADPSSDFSYLKMMTKGDRTCAWKISMEQKEVNKPDPDELVHRLKLRLVNGEISKEEYADLLELISR